MHNTEEGFVRLTDLLVIIDDGRVPGLEASALKAKNEKFEAPFSTRVLALKISY